MAYILMPVHAVVLLGTLGHVFCCVFLLPANAIGSCEAIHVAHPVDSVPAS